ncbi:MAG: FecR domain-containing protein [Candidatus Omnitrophica bacterium]|nr:FecR domain-containing protein [Candidatus Omnitrophota bacterium]
MKKFFLLVFFIEMAYTVAYADSLIVEEAQGPVEILKKDTSDWVAVQKGFKLEAGDKVKTGDSGTASVLISQGKVTLGEKTEFGVVNYTLRRKDLEATFELLLGKLRIKIDKLSKRSRIQILTPTSLVSVFESSLDLWVYEYLGAIFTRVEVSKGLANLLDPETGDQVDVLAGQYSTGGKGGVTKSKPVVSVVDTYPPPANIAKPPLVRPPVQVPQPLRVEIPKESVTSKTNQSKGSGG